MFIPIKNKYDIVKMRVVGRLAAEVLEIIEKYIEPGISTGELDLICHKYITEKQDAISATLGYFGFPKSICTSINDVVCHGIPCFKSKLKDGDILNIDVTIKKDGFYCDTSKMFIVGNPTIIGEKLCSVAKESLYLAIRMVKPGIYLNILGKSIQQFVESRNFSVVREYCGHGIGRDFHELPQVLHYESYNDLILKTGMTFTIEPMINSGGRQVFIMEDGWTVKTKDNSLSAQYEHTVVVTRDGCEVLTIRSDDTIPSIMHNL